MLTFFFTFKFTSNHFIYSFISFFFKLLKRAFSVFFNCHGVEVVTFLVEPKKKSQTSGNKKEL